MCGAVEEGEPGAYGERVGDEDVVCPDLDEGIVKGGGEAAVGVALRQPSDSEYDFALCYDSSGRGRRTMSARSLTSPSISSIYATSSRRSSPSCRAVNDAQLDERPTPRALNSRTW